MGQGSDCSEQQMKMRAEEDALLDCFDRMDKARSDLSQETKAILAVGAVLSGVLDKIGFNDLHNGEGSVMGKPGALEALVMSLRELREQLAE